MDFEGFVIGLAMVAAAWGIVYLLMKMHMYSAMMLGCPGAIVALGLTLLILIAFPLESLTLIALMGAYLFIQERLG